MSKLNETGMDISREESCGKPSMIKFLFFDNRTYEYINSFTKHLGLPEKYHANPIVVPDRDYEHGRIHLYGTVLYDREEDKFKMWYSTHYWNPDAGEMDPQSLSYLCYAVSADGITWEKPDLDIVPGTNIVMDNSYGTHGPTVLIDDHHTGSNLKYKLIMSPYIKDHSENGLKVYTSGDGTHWNALNDNLALDVNSDCHIGFCQDSRTSTYRTTFRTKVVDRRVWISESRDLVHWKDPVLALEPDQDDSCETQMYGMQITQYGDYLLGIVSMYYTFGYDVDPNYKKMFGTMDIQLAYSRDGYCWHRCFQGEKFIPNGEENTWDANLVIPASTVVYADNKILLFYSGAPYTHGTSYMGDQNQSCGVAVLRPDGFVGLSAGPETAELMTRPFMTGETEFYINADAGDGMIELAVCDTTGKEIDGFGYQDFIPITGDSLSHECKWGNQHNHSYKNTPIRLKVKARNAVLYSIYLPNGDDPREYWKFKEIRCVDPVQDIK